MDFIVFIVFQFIVFIFSVMVHEISHGVVAEKLGDPTARMAGRLTFNPISHIDPFGSIILPVMLAITGLPVVGWAKPVPYNPRNLRDPIGGGAKIAAAGPASNFAVALVIGLLLRFMLTTGVGLVGMLPLFLGLIVLINVVLGVFNLLPIPPFDGSKVLYAFLPPTQQSYEIVRFLEQYGIYIILALFFLGFPFVGPATGFIFRAIVGVSTGTFGF